MFKVTPAAARQIQQFAVAQQEGRAGRAAEAGIANGEGLVQQHPARCQGLQQDGKQRPMQVVGHHDRREPAAGERPWTALQIGGHDLHSRLAGQIRDSARVDIDADHRMAPGVEEAQVPAAAAGEVENRAGSRHQRRETLHPGGCAARPMGRALPRNPCRFRFRNQDFNSMTYRQGE